MSTRRLDESISCQEVRASFPDLETLDAEQRGRVRGHLERCEDCFSVLMEQVAQEELEAEDLPASLLESARGVVSAYVTAQRGVLGLMWDKLTQLVAQGEEWAEEKLEEARRWLGGTMVLWQMEPTIDAAAALGPGALMPVMGAKEIAALVVDVTWQPQGRVVPFEVKRVEEEPRITADGRFTCTLYTREAQWQGAQVVCTLLLVEGQRVSFESVVEADPSGQGGVVRFTAEGLPSGENEVPVPLYFVEFSIVAPNRAAL